MNKIRTITGVCCQWWGGASYDSDEHIETVVLRRNFRGKIATQQQALNRNNV